MQTKCRQKSAKDQKNASPMRKIFKIGSLKKRSGTFKLGFIGEFIFGGVASLAPSGRGLPRSGWRSPAARRIKARKIAIFLGHAEIISSKIASSRGLPQSPSAPAPSRREPYNSTSNSPPNPNLNISNRPTNPNLKFSNRPTNPNLKVFKPFANPQFEVPANLTPAVSPYSHRLRFLGGSREPFCKRVPLRVPPTNPNWNAPNCSPTPNLIFPPKLA